MTLLLLAVQGLTFYGWSDQHVGTKGEVAHVEPFVEAMNAMEGTAWPAAVGGAVERPAFVLGAGDITEWPTAAARDAYDALRARLKIPIYDVLGNHDDGGESPSETMKKWAIARHGALSYAFDAGGVRFIALWSVFDAKAPPAQPIDAAALEFLRQELAAAGRERPVVVVTHLCYEALTNRDALVEALGDANVIFVAGGHYHKASVNRYRGRLFVQFPSPKSDRTDFTVVRITPTKLTVVPYDFRKKEWVAVQLVDEPIRGPREAPIYPDKAKLMMVREADGKETPVATPADWARRRAHILANFEKVAGPLPDRARACPLEVQVHEETPLEGMVRKRISFASEPGDRVPAYLFVPTGGRKPAMLCLHQTTAMGKGEPAGLGDRNLSYALELARRGFVTLAPDYPNYGDYKVDPYARGYTSATMKGIWNHMRAVDVLESLPEVDAKRIGTIGHSLGGHNSIFVALFDPRLKVVVSSCGFNAFPKYYGGNLAGWSHKGYMPRIADVYGKDPARMPFDFTELTGALAPRAFFINAPLGDANFEVSGVRDCVAAAAPVYALLGAKDALHPVYPDAAHAFPPEIREQAYRFIEGVLKRD